LYLCHASDRGVPVVRARTPACRISTTADRHAPWSAFCGVLDPPASIRFGVPSSRGVPLYAPEWTPRSRLPPVRDYRLRKRPIPIFRVVAVPDDRGDVPSIAVSDCAGGAAPDLAGRNCASTLR